MGDLALKLARRGTVGYQNGEAVLGDTKAGIFRPYPPPPENISFQDKIAEWMRKLLVGEIPQDYQLDPYTDQMIPIERREGVIPVRLMTPELKTKLAQKYGVDLSNPIPVNRAQREPTELGFATQGGRGQVFTSFGEEYGGYMGTGNTTEGGENLVKALLEPKNPLFHKHEGGFIGDTLIKKFLGGGKINPKGNLNTEFTPRRGLGEQVIRELSNITSRRKTLEDLRNYRRSGDQVAAKILETLTPKDVSLALEAGDPEAALKEALAAKLVRNAGYDTTIKLRRKGSNIMTNWKNQADDLALGNIGPAYNIISNNAYSPPQKYTLLTEKFPEINWESPSTINLRPTQVTLVDKDIVKKARQAFIETNKPENRINNINSKEFNDAILPILNTETGPNYPLYSKYITLASQKIPGSKIIETLKGMLEKETIDPASKLTMDALKMALK